MRRLLLGLTLFFSGAAEAAPDPSEAFTKFEQAQTLGDAAGARAALNAILEDTKQSGLYGESWSKLGDLETSRGHSYGALIAYVQATATGTDRLREALALTERLGDEGPVASLGAAKGVKPLDAAVQGQFSILLARDLARKSRYDEALAQLKNVDKSSPAYARSLELKGVLLNLQGKPSEALAPLITAEAIVNQDEGSRSELPDEFRNTLALNLGRTYYAAGNFIRAIEYDAKVDRGSRQWPEAAFERAWAHFRLNDVPGALGLLQNHGSPFLEGLFNPEADMLRAYSLFVLCKFPAAREEIEAYGKRYTPFKEALDHALPRIDATGAWADGVAAATGRPTLLPRALLIPFIAEDRMTSARLSVAAADTELSEAADDRLSRALRERQNVIIQSEGERILMKARKARDELAAQLVNIQITRIDMMQYETRLYERAAATGQLNFGDKVGKVRRDTARVDERSWPFDGEYWADELGYYRYNLRPDCSSDLAVH